MKKQITIFTIVVSASMSLCGIISSLAYADMDWTRGEPTMRIDDEGSVCDESRENVTDWISGDVKTMDLCIVYGKSFDMAYTYGTKNGDSLQPLIRLHGTDNYIFLLGTVGAQLIPGTDTLIYSRKNQLHPVLVLVNNFTKVLKPTYIANENIPPEKVRYYNLDISVFDKEILPSTIAWGNGVSSYRISSDGHYIVAYFKNTGIVKYNLVTNQITRLLTVSSLKVWSPTNQPRIESVSNDGRFIFLAPEGQIIDTKNCGDASNEPFDYLTQILHPCRVRENSSSIRNLVGQTAQIRGAQFSDDSNVLSFFTLNTEGGSEITHRIVMGATDVKYIKYLALGDSYSSGEGDISYSDGKTNYLPGTDSRDQCHISYRSYPFLLKEKWNIADEEMRSIACSGARVLPDYFGTDEYTGQHNDLRDKSIEERVSQRNDALNNFVPGIIRQIDFISKYKPDVITLTGGGNDVGFGQIIAYCASPHLNPRSSCPQVSDPQISANLRKTIDDVRVPLTNFIKKIKNTSPTTKLYLIGYPQFIALNGCLDGSELLNLAERQMIRSNVARLNNILKLVARDADVYYVDIEDSLDGGQICQGSTYMTGPLKIGDKILKGYTQESYHPNADGHKRIANVINERIKNDDLSYTIVNIPPEESGQRVIRKAVTKDYVGIGSEQTVAMDPGMFHPDGSVDIVGFSSRVLLSRVKVAPDGSLSVKIKIPSEMEEGYHLLTVTGKGVDGDALQVQQYIMVTNSNHSTQPTGVGPLTRLTSDDIGFEDASQKILLNGNAERVSSFDNRSQLAGLSITHSSGRDSIYNHATSMENIFMIWISSVTIAGIIIKGAVYATKKEN